MCKAVYCVVLEVQFQNFLSFAARDREAHEIKFSITKNHRDLKLYYFLKICTMSNVGFELGKQFAVFIM